MEKVGILFVEVLSLFLSFFLSFFLFSFYIGNKDACYMFFSQRNGYFWLMNYMDC